ncbi:MAG: hypothetical protein IPF66_12510 [Holophagales bacterium]|nr:hypothetical protein [Holophagales bacterium]
MACTNATSGRLLGTQPRAAMRPAGSVPGATGQAPAFLRISAEAASTSSSKISLTRRNGQVKSARTSGSGMRAASAGNCASGVLGMKPDDTDS